LYLIVIILYILNLIIVFISVTFRIGEVVVKYSKRSNSLLIQDELLIKEFKLHIIKTVFKDTGRQKRKNFVFSKNIENHSDYFDETLCVFEKHK